MHPIRRGGSRPLPGRGGRGAVEMAHAPPECGDADAEFGGGLAAVAAVAAQGLADGGLLGMREALAQLRAGMRLGSSRAGLRLQILRMLEMAGQEDVAFGETDGPLERVAQLPDVARPGLLHQPCE